jgi:protein-L-isoaspartate O-methyltransferase
MATSGQSRKLRRQLVRALEDRGLIRTPPVREAFLKVPREVFVPEFGAREGLVAVYRDEAILTKWNAQGGAAQLFVAAGDHGADARAAPARGEDARA